MFSPNKFTEKGMMDNRIFTFQNFDDNEVNVMSKMCFNGKVISLEAIVSINDWLKACEDYIFSEYYKRYGAD